MWQDSSILWMNMLLFLEDITYWKENKSFDCPWAYFSQSDWQFWVLTLVGAWVSESDKYLLLDNQAP